MAPRSRKSLWLCIGLIPRPSPTISPELAISALKNGASPTNPRLGTLKGRQKGTSSLNPEI